MPGWRDSGVWTNYPGIKFQLQLIMTAFSEYFALHTLAGRYAQFIRTLRYCIAMQTPT